MYGEGISHEGCIVDLGVELELITKSGAWYSYGDVRLGQGKEKAKEYLKDNPELLKEIENKIRAMTITKVSAAEGEAEVAAPEE